MLVHVATFSTNGGIVTPSHRKSLRDRPPIAGGLASVQPVTATPISLPTAKVTPAAAKPISS
jgi:hypothetical protein